MVDDGRADTGYLPTAQVTLCSFKSRANINEKGDGPYRGFGYSNLISDL